MSAGDLLAADRQIELRGYLMGASCDWDNMADGWSDPLGGETVSVEADRALSDGVATGFDRQGAIVFTVGLWTPRCFDEAQAWLLVEELRDTWRASGREKLELHLQLPGLGHRYLVGKPRAPQVTTTNIREGVAFAFCSFLGSDGVLHTPGVASS